MNKLLVTALLATSILVLPQPSAQAGDDKAIAAIGGFVAGLITGSMADNHSTYDRRASYYSDRSYRDHSRHYDRSRSDRYYSHSDYSSYKAPRVSGRWETRRVKKWVPGYWEVSYNHCGDRIRTWRSGYYRYETERVWVDFCNTDHHYRR